MAKTTEEDTNDLTEETLPEVAADVLEPEEVEEVIPDEEGKPTIVRKKVAALKARHRLEDYFEMKRIQDELDYLDDEKKRKAALLLRVTEEARLDKEIKHEKPIKKAKIEAKKEVKPDVKEVKGIQSKPKQGTKPKAKPKPQHKPAKKARKKSKK
jgi:hypothetical protein